MTSDNSLISDALADQFALPGQNDSFDITKLKESLYTEDLDIDRFTTNFDFIYGFKALNPSTSYGSEIPFKFLRILLKS